LGQVFFCDQQRAAALFQNLFHVGVIQLTAERGLTLLDLRVNVFRKFRDDVVLLRTRQPELNCLQVTI
jgi:hypothetical protein